MISRSFSLALLLIILGLFTGILLGKTAACNDVVQRYNSLVDDYNVLVRSQSAFSNYADDVNLTIPGLNETWGVS